MKILVTGGAGFIGSHLCERLLRDGAEVDAVDDLSTGKIQNLNLCLSNSQFRFVKGSVLDQKLMHTLIDKNEMIYHLAAAVGVNLIVQQPVKAIETNIRGTEVVLELAEKFSRKVILTSSSEVYGKNGKVPFKEEDDCRLGSTTFSRWSYACSKAIDEFLGLAYYSQFGLQVLIVRLFNTVGERQIGDFGMVVPRFVEAALRQEPLQVYGDGKQTRCFAYVADVINGLVALANDSSAYGNVYNIGSTEEISIEDLAHKIITATGSSSSIEYVPYVKVYKRHFDDMRRRVPSIEKIHKQVGYRTKTSLDETLERVIKYFQNELCLQK